MSPRPASSTIWLKGAAAAFALASTAQALVLNTGTLSIAPTGTLDLKNNNLVVRSGVLGVPTAGVYNGITGYIQTGLNINGVIWAGFGINSSVAAANPSGITAIGILNNAEAGYLSWPPLEPITLVGTEILAKYTYFGDSDLGGTVDDGVDFQQFLLGLNSLGTLTGWLYGDYDYNGTTDDGQDFQLFLLGFNGPNTPLVGQGPELGAAAVPEPSSFALLAFGALRLASRRNRKQ